MSNLKTRLYFLHIRRVVLLVRLIIYINITTFITRILPDLSCPSSPARCPFWLLIMNHFLERNTFRIMSAMGWCLARSVINFFFSDDQDFSTNTDKLRISCITDGAKPTRYVPLIKRYTTFLRLISPDFDFIRYHGEILLLVAWKLLRSRLHERNH